MQMLQIPVNIILCPKMSPFRINRYNSLCIMLYIKICIDKKLLEQGRTVIRMTLLLQVLNQFLLMSNHNLGQKPFRHLKKCQLVTNSFEA